MAWEYHDPKFEYEEKFGDTGWPWSGHKNFAYDLVCNTKPKIIVELGTHYGTSFWSFCQAAKDEKIACDLNAVDTWKGEVHAGLYGEEVFDEVKEIQKRYYKDLKIKLIRKTFDETLPDFEEQSIDLLHIDGLHTYEAVKHDFENWNSKVKDNGIIIFHDIFVDQNDFGVYKLWEELKKKYKTMELHHSFGLGVLFKNEEKCKEMVKDEREMQMKYSFFSEERKNSEINNSLQHIHQKDAELEKRNKAIHQKDAELQQRDQAIHQKDSELQQRDQVIHQKDAELEKRNKVVQQREKEIKVMKVSIFWKFREIYLRIKSIFIKQRPIKSSSNSKNILFISHDASRSGAPFVLLYFLCWLKENTDVKFTIFLQRGGELEDEFRAIAPVYFRDMDIINSGYPKLVYHIIKYSGLRTWANRRKIFELFKREKFDLIFANSIASSDSIIELKKIADIPVINYIHELENAIWDCCGIETFNEAKHFVGHYIGSSRPVIENLIQNHDIPKEKIELVYDYIPVKKLYASRNSFDNAKLKEEFDVPRNAFIVGASGTIEWRKGVDLFPQIASIALQKSNVPIYFFWIGGDRNNTENGKIFQDLRKMKLQNKVFFVDYKIDYFSAIDVFVLPSREDPFPLVCLQAAAFEKPIICFDKAGGMPEFVGEECGFVAPYLNVEKVGEKIAYLAENRNVGAELGRNAAKKVLERHDVEKVSKKLLKIINKISL